MNATHTATASNGKPFRICRSRGHDGRLLNGSWYSGAVTDPPRPARYVCIESRSDDRDRLTGYVSPEAFTAVMRALVSVDYDTPNWCEKCHLAGIDGYCRCAVAANE